MGLYGLTLVRTGKIDEGYKYGILACKILEKFPSRELAAKTRLSIAMGGQAMKEPYRKAASSMLAAHDLGMKTGDVETAIRSYGVYFILRTYIGDSLSAISTIYCNLQHICDEYGHSDFTVVRPFRDASLVLIGQSQDLPGKAELKACLEGDEAPSVYMVCGWCFLATYVTDLDYRNALLAVLKRLKSQMMWVSPFIRVFQTFHEAVIKSEIAKKSNKATQNESIVWIRKRLELLRTSALNCPQNCWSKVYLVEAELDILATRYDVALMKFDRAIDHAEKEGFLNEEALAYEKAGRMLLDCHRESDARWYLSRSSSLYERWGARAKAQQIHKMLPETSSRSFSRR